MQTYHLQTEFIDPSAEQALIACLVSDRSQFSTLLDALHPELFVQERNTWNQMLSAFEIEQLPVIPSHWSPAPDPHAAVQRLIDLFQRRLFAVAQERLAQALFNEAIPATSLTNIFEEELLKLQTSVRAAPRDVLQWADALLPAVLTNALARKQRREETGIPFLGVVTGFPYFDNLLGGLTEGLYLLGGQPGGGKTTFALQIAAHVARTIPVLFITFEHAPANLLLKALCAKANLNPQLVQRGLADVDALYAASLSWEPTAKRLALIEGNSQLTVGHVRMQARRAMQYHQTDQCLVIVDYLQLWAKVAEELRADSLSVRERVEILGSSLRELALQLRSPVIALASQNRAQGQYGSGKGIAALDSLKESGDLEYTADVVLFLTASSERQVVPPARAVDLTVAKNRHGDIGKAALIFRPDVGMLREEG